MRIALVHIRHAYTGGVERYLNSIARFLADRGHDVTIVCRRHAEAPHREVRIEKLHGFALGKTWRIWAFAKDVERHVARERYDVVFSLGRTWAHDVIRLGSGLHGTYMRLAHDAKLSLLERLTGGGATRHRLVLAIERRALGPTGRGKVIVNSHMVARDAAREYGLASERVQVIHNGVDVEHFHPRRRAAEGAALRRELGLADEPTVLFLGTGYGRKGLDLVLDAFPALLRKRRDARLLVVGHDSAPGRFEARAAALGIDHAVRFLGGRSNPEAWYAAADVYALPTRYDPFANSTVEALASGLPVVTSTTNGGSEVIDEGVQGSIVDAHAADAGEALGAALVHWTEPDALAPGRLAARRRAEEHRIEDKLAIAESFLLRLAAHS